MELTENTEITPIIQPELYEFILDDKKYQSKISNPTGKELLRFAKKEPVKCFTLYQKLKGCDFERISLDETVDLANKGVERFETKPPEEFEYTLDGEHEMTNKKVMTPLEILKKGGADEKLVYLVLIKPDEEVSYKDNLNAAIEMVCPTMKFETKLLTGTTVS